MRAWALLVVSSEGQRENLADYLDLARDDAERNGWTLERLDDFKAVASGKAGVRAPMIALVAAIAALPKERRPSWVWMRRVDRVGRGRATESMLALYSLHDLGVRIWDHDTGEVRLDTAEGELPTMLKTWFARVDNEIRSGKLRVVYEARRAAGVTVGNRALYGFRRLPDGTLTPIEDQADAIRTMFAMRAQGMGVPTIAKHLASAAPPRRFGDRDRRLRWTPRQVRDLLKRREYLGIVDEVTFRKVQQVTIELHREPTPRKYAWPMTGVTRCHCGYMMLGRSAGKRGYLYYRCAARWNHGGHYFSVTAGLVEKQFLDLLQTIAADPGLVTAYRRAATITSPKLVQRALAVAQRELRTAEARAQRVWTLNERGLLRDEDLQMRLDELRAERQTLETRIADLTSELTIAHASQRDDSSVHELISEAARIYEGATGQDQRRIARAVGIALGGFCVEPDRQLTVRRPQMADCRKRVGLDKGP